MKTKLLWIAVVAVLCTPWTANALEWDFWNIAANGTVLSTPQNVNPTTPPSLTINLSAFSDTTNTSPSGVFFERNLGAGSDERGLGVCQGSVGAALNCSGEGNPGVEIDPGPPNEAVRVVLPAGATGYKLLFNSLTPFDTSSEMVDIRFGPTFAGSALLGTLSHNQNVVLLNGDQAESFSIPDADIGGNIWVTPHPGGGAPNNVLLYGATSTVPEPGTILLLGSGLVGFVLYRRRKA